MQLSKDKITLFKNANERSVIKLYINSINEYILILKKKHILFNQSSHIKLEH